MGNHTISVKDPKRALVETAVGVLFFSTKPVPTCYLQIAVRDKKIGKLLAEKCQSVFAVFFQRIGRDHYELSPRPEDLCIILLQRSSHARCSVRVIPVTVLAHKNQFLMTCCQLAKRNSPMRRVDEKCRGFLANLRPCWLSAHHVPPFTVSSALPLAHREKLVQAIKAPGILSEHLFLLLRGKICPLQDGLRRMGVPAVPVRKVRTEKDNAFSNPMENIRQHTLLEGFRSLSALLLPSPMSSTTSSEDRLFTTSCFLTSRE